MCHAVPAADRTIFWEAILNRTTIFWEKICASDLGAQQNINIKRT